MKKWLKEENRWVAIAALLTGILIVAPIKVENRRLQWANWTGFGQDEEITVTDKFADPKCEGTNPQCQIQERTRVRKVVSGKTLWDVLSLLGVPLALAILGFWLQQVQQKRADEAAKLQREQAESAAARERRQADEAAKEEVLQAYFDRISTLLIDKNIIALAVRQDKAGKSKTAGNLLNNLSIEPVTDEQKELIYAAKDVIQARTLSVLRRLESDAERKTDVIRFLAETEIVSKLKLNLSGVDLSHTNLSHANLSHAYLANTDLTHADLSYANFSYADLIIANLSNTTLSHTDLSHASLCFATLTYLDDVKLRSAIILRTDLSTAKGLTQEQLEEEEPPYLCKAILPPHITIDPNRDCKQLPRILQERYPEQFKTIEEAQQYIDSL